MVRKVGSGGAIHGRCGMVLGARHERRGALRLGGAGMAWKVRRVEASPGLAWKGRQGRQGRASLGTLGVASQGRRGRDGKARPGGSGLARRAWLEGLGDARCGGAG